MLDRGHNMGSGLTVLLEYINWTLMDVIRLLLFESALLCH